MHRKGGVTEVRVTPIAPAAAPNVVVNCGPSPAGAPVTTVTPAPGVTVTGLPGAVPTVSFTLTGDQVIALIAPVNPGLAAVLRANPVLAAQVGANPFLVNLLLTNPTVASIMAACPTLLAQVAVSPVLTAQFAAVFGFPFFFPSFGALPSPFGTLPGTVIG